MSLTLTNIPAIMRAKGYNNGARLMEIWFSRASATKPAYGPPDTATITMDAWTLKFGRAKAVYDQMMREKIWSNPAGRTEVAKMLRRKGLVTSGGQSFSTLQGPVPTLHADHVQTRAVGFGLTDLDDMSCALGNFAFHVLVGGTVEPLPRPATGHRVTITHVGVYVRDSYDFNDDQFLGFWDDSDNSISMLKPLSGTSVNNSDFRAWRTTNGRGGDFLVYSDIKITALPTPDTFNI